MSKPRIRLSPTIIMSMSISGRIPPPYGAAAEAGMGWTELLYEFRSYFSFLLRAWRSHTLPMSTVDIGKSMGILFFEG